MNQYNRDQVTVCNYCVMDDSIESIRFDHNGMCNCCRPAVARRTYEYWPDEVGASKLSKIISSIKNDRKRNDYDCIMGLSGGIDSSYLAHLIVEEFGLRPLAVHVDGGWNSAPAVKNIYSLVSKLDIDLFTHVVEWSEMQSLQTAFLRSHVQNQDIPQDHVFFSVLHKQAIERGIKYFLSGDNYATESVIPPLLGHSYMDSNHLRAINKRFGSKPLSQYESMSFLKFLYHSRIRKSLKVIRPLNYTEYSKDSAMKLLKEKYGWVDYGGKHHESRFTQFYELVYLPQKFGFDKRKLHLSSLIVSGQITREEALKILHNESIDSVKTFFITKFVAKKLNLSLEDLNNLIKAPPIPHTQYPNTKWLLKLLVKLKKILGLGDGSV